MKETRTEPFWLWSKEIESDSRCLLDVKILVPPVSHIEIDASCFTNSKKLIRSSEKCLKNFKWIHLKISPPNKAQKQPLPKAAANICAHFGFPFIACISLNRILASSTVYAPSLISLDNWLTATTLSSFAEDNGIYFTFANPSPSSLPAVVKIPLLSTK